MTFQCLEQRLGDVSVYMGALRCIGEHLGDASV